MLEYMLNYLASTPAMIIYLLAMTYMLNFRHRWLFIIGLYVSMLAAKIIFGYIFGLSAINSGNIFIFIMLIAFVMLMSEGKPAEKLGVLLLILLVVSFSEASGLLVFRSLGGQITSSNAISAFSNPSAFFLTHAFYLIMAATMSYAVAVAWNRVIRKRGGDELWWFLLFPLSQIVFFLMVVDVIADYSVKQRPYIMFLASLLLGLAADVVIFFAIRWIIRARVEKQRASFMDEQLKQQYKYYERMRDDVEAASKMRHDIRNQLQTAYLLFEQGDVDFAHEQLKGISNRIESNEVYCGNPVVNAVLCEKAAQCRKLSAEADFSVNIPNDCSIDGVDLCSLFANVLDNAITACSLSGSEEPMITVRAGEESGYFILHCVNSALPPDNKTERKPTSSHGWGLTIIEEIAGHYDGRLETNYSDRYFDTHVWLKYPS